jgi:hypothetical protein
MPKKKPARKFRLPLLDRIPLTEEWKHKVNNRASIFFFFGLAASLVVIAFAWQSTAVGRLGFGEPVDNTRLLKALPANATVAADGYLELATPNSWVVGWAVDGRAYAGLVTGGTLGRLELVSQLDLTAYDPDITGQPGLDQRIIGANASPAYIIRAGAGEGTLATLLATVQTGRLVPMVRVDGGGRNVLALFYDGFVSDGQEQFSLEDVDDDGTLDAVMRGQYFVMGDGSPGRNESASVFLWDGTAWQFDHELSWALTVRNGLFPEPPVYPGPVN